VRLLETLFRPGIPDPLNHQAGSYDGALSILVGIASNESIKQRKMVRIKDLVPLDKFRPTRRQGVCFS
jgi:hypothetical protein